MPQRDPAVSGRPFQPSGTRDAVKPIQLRVCFWGSLAKELIPNLLPAKTNNPKVEGFNA